MYNVFYFRKLLYGLNLVFFYMYRDISQPTSSPVGRNFECITYRSGTIYINNRRQPTYRTRCSVSRTAGCARGDTAAVVCGESSPHC